VQSVRKTVVPMDVSPLKAKFDSLRGEVAGKGDALARLDNSPEDQFPEKGDVFVRDCPAGEEGKSFTGSLQLNRETGRPAMIDLEETAPDGSRTRYLYKEEKSEDSTTATFLKKSDTHKLKATLTEKPGSLARVRMEEINFVESALNPEIESRSEAVKKSVVDAGSSVEMLDNTDLDRNKAPGVVQVENAPVFSPGGGKREFTGTVTAGGSGGFSQIELVEGVKGEPQAEYYFVSRKDCDYYKKSGINREESTQIFDREEPKLVLYQEDTLFHPAPPPES